MASLFITSRFLEQLSACTKRTSFFGGGATWPCPATFCALFLNTAFQNKILLELILLFEKAPTMLLTLHYQKPWRLPHKIEDQSEIQKLPPDTERFEANGSSSRWQWTPEESPRLEVKFISWRSKCRKLYTHIRMWYPLLCPSALLPSLWFPTSYTLSSHPNISNFSALFWLQLVHFPWDNCLRRTSCNWWPPC